MSHLTVRFILLAVISVTAVACGGGDEGSTTPTAPTGPATVTETFNGTVARNGAVTHPFITDGGTVTATLSTLSPDSTAIVGLTLGTWNGTGCQASISNDRATQGTTIFGSASGSGNLCVRVHDATGTLTEPASYEVQVVHPQN